MEGQPPQLIWTAHSMERCSQRVAEVPFWKIKYSETAAVGRKRKARMRQQFPGGKRAFDRMEFEHCRTGCVWRVHLPTETILVLRPTGAGGKNFLVITVYQLKYKNLKKGRAA